MIFVVPVFHVLSSAQHPLSKTLLWRISGNGLQQPSYVYGTMHLSDKRLFNFSDSVYRAIENTQGLAIEVNPDEMFAYMINQVMEEKQNSRSLKDILGNRDYNRYAQSLGKKFGKPASEITARDIVNEKNKWMSEYLKKGEMPTFVDGYLYSIGKRQGKWIGGIEDIADQANIQEDIVDKSDITYLLADHDKNTHATLSTENNRTIEKMIRLYTAGDIEGIDDFENQSSATIKDILLINRNVKMARRMDSLANIRSMFFAIGAAHLAGDSGVVRLLESRGFKVDPVFSSTKTSASDYKFKEVDLPWTIANDALYNIAMPGHPVLIRPMGLFNVHFVFDIEHFITYSSMALLSPKTISNSDSVFLSIKKNMFHEQKNVTEKSLYSNGLKGREFIGTSNSYPIKMQVFLQGKVIYMLMVNYLKKNITAARDIDKFFGSFSAKKQENHIADTPMTDYTDSMLGIHFKAPVAQFNPQSSNEHQDGWKFVSQIGIDPSAGCYVMLITKELNAGMRLNQSNTVYESLKTLIHKQYINVKIQDTLIQGNKAYMASGRNALENFYTKTLSSIYGNRMVFLMALGDSLALESPAIRQMFHSFQFIPSTTNHEWNLYTNTSNDFRTWAPSPIRDHKEDNDHQLLYLSYDTTTSTSYFIVPDTLDRYTWSESDTAFLKNYASNHLNQDSTIRTQYISNGTLTGYECLTTDTNSTNLYSLARFFLSGNIVYKLVMYGSKEMVADANTEKFFSDFKINKQLPSFVHISKADTLINDLESKDSTTRIEAYRHIIQAPFTQKDLPLLHGALFRKYKPLGDWDISSNAINKAIGKKLSLMADSSTVLFIDTQYSGFTNKDTLLRELALTTLARMTTISSYQSLLSHLNQSPLLAKPSYTFESGLKDSLSLTATILPQLLLLSKDSVMMPILANISLNLLDSGMAKLSNIEPYRKDFEYGAANQLSYLSTLGLNQVDYDYYSLIELLARFNNPSSFAILQRYLKVKDLWFKNFIVSQLLKNKQVVSSSTLNSLAADVSTRTQLYSNLESIHKKALFPAQYLTRQYFAQADIYNASMDDEDPGTAATSVNFVQTIRSKYKGTDYVFYLFRVDYKTEEDTKSYLGIAGGYKINGTNVEPSNPITGIYFKDNFDAGKVRSLFKAYLNSLSENGNEDQND